MSIMNFNFGKPLDRDQMRLIIGGNVKPKCDLVDGDSYYCSHDSSSVCVEECTEVYGENCFGCSGDN
ncbi:hypothetical protein SAMN05660226_03848 [Parapedobacter luteus]|uniref:Natural product n=1 Tax=Parapedobacter luteus TaxID=623280 RepID=A0A1T5F9F3_9SPHI|nr:hypothetical protein SAMN05660226_03848 [Parapedobacter luteus]